MPLIVTAISFQPGLQYQAYITSCGVVVTYNYNVVCCSQNIYVIIASMGILCMAVQNYSIQSLFFFLCCLIFSETESLCVMPRLPLISQWSFWLNFPSIGIKEMLKLKIFFNYHISTNYITNLWAQKARELNVKNKSASGHSLVVKTKATK